jgi:hypothetical protein
VPLVTLGRSGIPSVTTVLFAATRPGQVSANLGALALAGRLTPGERERLAAVGT